MNSFMSWVGGKKSLRDEILIRFSLEYERYIEVFGGAGWVLFHKTPEAFEVFNDANSNLVNLYRCVRKNLRKLIKKLMFMINSRDDFRCIVEQRRRGLFARFRDYDRAAKFYYLILFSYGHKTDQYCCKPVSMWKKFPLIERAASRLQSVAIDKEECEKLYSAYSEVPEGKDNISVKMHYTMSAAVSIYSRFCWFRTEAIQGWLFCKGQIPPRLP